MTLPISVAIELAEAVEDEELTQQEAESMLASVFGSLIGAVVIAYGMLMFNRVMKGGA